MYQFGFIGMGNMGSAMLKGCLSVFPANTLAFSRKDAAKGEALSLETGAVWIDSNRTCAEQSRYIILADPQSPLQLPPYLLPKQPEQPLQTAAE